MGLKEKLFGSERKKNKDEERKLQQEIEVEAKKAENDTFHEQYRIKRIAEAKAKGKRKAALLAHKKATGEGGILDTLGKIGEDMNSASKGIMKGIEINPDGMEESFGPSKKKEKKLFNLDEDDYL